MIFILIIVLITLGIVCLGMLFYIRALKKTNSTRLVPSNGNDILIENAIFRALVKRCPLGVMVLDKNKTVVFINSATERIFGWSAAEIVGRSNPIIPHFKEDEFSQVFNAAINGKNLAALDTQRLHKDGSLVDVRIWNAPLEEGPYTFGLALFEDIAPRRKHEEQLRLAKIAADDANQAKTTFLANVSHEMRTPLTAIIGFSEIIAKTIPSPGEEWVSQISNYNDVIYRNGVILAELIQDLLDISRVEAGKMEVSPRKTNCRALLQDVVTTLSGRAKEKGLELRCSVADDVPPDLMTDGGRLRQILVNLIGNAVKFTDHGSVTVSACKAYDKINFYIEDTGEGIPSESKDLIFEPFYQAPNQSTKQAHLGTGLGLPLARRMAQALGGDLWLEDSAGKKGSKFVLAVDATMTPEVEADGKSNLTPLSLKVSQDAKVLLVEDEQDNQQLITSQLRHLGYTVDLAENGVKAVNRALSYGNYEFVLMDIRMPEMDGYQAINNLRKSGYDRKVIAVTAQAFEGDKASYLQHGFDAYLVKPFSLDQLQKTVASL